MTNNHESEKSASPDQGFGKSAAVGIGYLAAAAALFLVCSLIQAYGGSTMFNTRYRDQGFLKGLLVNLTFYPGWIGTLLLAGAGLVGLFGGFKKGDS